MEEPSLPRFLCDVMLARLARWLRAAGYDTALAAPDAPDDALVRRAVLEDRWLLTLDRQIADHRAGRGRVIVLEHGPVAVQAARLAETLALDWLARPFSRCLLDNALLTPASPHAVSRLPARVQAEASGFAACPACGRIYWAGSHHRRMHATLTAWQDAAVSR
ncbi:MAG: Mut7-C RNAse domain-containing protein [Burkholderiales bacterium]